MRNGSWIDVSRSHRNRTRTNFALLSARRGTSDDDRRPESFDRFDLLVSAVGGCVGSIVEKVRRLADGNIYSWGDLGAEHDTFTHLKH